MRKSTLLKLMGTCAAVMFSFGVMAQTYPATINTNYVEATETSYQTTGLGLRLYAAPDPVYSPNYATTPTPANINALSEWRWVYGISFADAGAIEVKPWTAAENYVDITAAQLPAAGSTRLFWAAERFGGAGCADAVGQSHLVTVLPAPTAAMVATNVSTNWTEVTADREYYRCSDGWTDNLALTFTETGVPAAYDDYAYTITVTATGYDAGGAVVVGPTDVTATYGTSVAATDATFVNASATYTTPAMTFLTFSGNNVRTQYVYTLATVASRISTLSHTRAGVANAFYNEAGADDVVTYWLNLPPVTGPIYHIPNTFAL